MSPSTDVAIIGAGPYGLSLAAHLQGAAIPFRLESFAAYGVAFQRRFAPALEEKLVTAVECASGSFRLKFQDRDVLTARCVAVAVGISHFHYVPPELHHLPSKLLTHSFAHG